MNKKPHFGQKKKVNGKEYTYKKNARGGNYGSWFLSENSSNNNSNLSGDIHNDFQQNDFDREEAVEDLYPLVDDLEEYTSRKIFEGGIKKHYPAFYDYIITQMEDTDWTDDNKNDYAIVREMSSIIQDDTLNDEEKQRLVKQEYDKFSPYEKPYRYSFSTSDRYPVSEQLQEIGKTIKAFADTSQYRRSEEDLQHLANLPLYNTNDGLILKEGKLGKQIENDIYYGSMMSSPYYNAGVQEFVENIEPLDIDETTPEIFFIDAVHKIRIEIAQSQALQLVSVFPTKELKDAMDRHDVKNVEVESFVNGRELGNVYTVMQPNGNTMSFSVYEHRNSDSIIINGKENWDKDDELPYAADHKNAYFAEINSENYEQAAEMLTYFMKEAQQGELPSTEELVRNAPRIDWNTKLSEQLGPSFQSFLDDHYPEEGQRVRKNLEGKQTDEDILRDLDF